MGNNQRFDHTGGSLAHKLGTGTRKAFEVSVTICEFEQSGGPSGKSISVFHLERILMEGLVDCEVTVQRPDAGYYMGQFSPASNLWTWGFYWYPPMCRRHQRTATSSQTINYLRNPRGSPSS